MSSLWSDDPIDRREDDLLDRHRFAVRVAALIREAGPTGRSAVFGLVGPWGDGKTSLINLVEKELPTPWTVVRFTPWAASSVSDLLAEFFSTIASALPAEGKGTKARESLLACAQVAVPALLKLIPAIGGTAADLATAAGSRLVREKPWAVRFEEASQQLHALNIPVLVVADDVDRLDAGELATLLKAVRLLGRFPGVHYLLAYDQNTVIDVLSRSATVGSSPHRALEFLEKIVQHPLPIPPAQRPQLDRMLRAGLTDVLTASGHELDRDAADRFSLAYQDLIARTLTTIRSVQRYLAQARTYLPLLDKNEVDVVDLLILIHLRLRLPQLYGQLPSWRSELTGALDLASLVSPRTKEPDWTARISGAGVSSELVRPVENVLRDVFPAMGGASVTQRGSARGCRAGNADYFDRYFAIGIPQDDIADTLVRQALADVTMNDHGGSRDAFVAVLTGSDEDLALRALSKAAPMSLTMQPSTLAELARFVAALVPQLPDAPMLTGNVRHTAIAWLAVLLQGATITDPARFVGDLVQAAGVNAVAQTAYLMNRDRLDRSSDAVDRLLPHVASHLRTAVLNNFAAGDNANVSDLVMTMVGLLEDCGELDALVADIRAGLDRAAWTLEDVASRFVAVHQMVGGSAGWEINELRMEQFAKVVPAPDDTTPLHIEENTSRRAEVAATPDVDRHDVSWPNRRLVARHALQKLGWDL